MILYLFKGVLCTICRHDKLLSVFKCVLSYAIILVYQSFCFLFVVERRKRVNAEDRESRRWVREFSLIRPLNSVLQSILASLINQQTCSTGLCFVHLMFMTFPVFWSQAWRDCNTLHSATGRSRSGYTEIKDDEGSLVADIKKSGKQGAQRKNKA